MTSDPPSANHQHTHSIMAGSVDNVDLLEVPIQEVSADGQDVTTTTVVLLNSHTLGQAGTRHGTAGKHTAHGEDGDGDRRWRKRRMNRKYKTQFKAHVYKRHVLQK